MRIVWLAVLLVCIAAVIALLVLTARGAVSMPLGLLLAVPALLLGRLAWARRRDGS